MEISKIDQNFKTEAAPEDGLRFIPAANAPMEISGLPFFYQEHIFCRLSKTVLDMVNENLRNLSYMVTGGKIRFQTDSAVVALKAKLLRKTDMRHMPRSATHGFDVYIGSGRDKIFVKTVMCNESGYDIVSGIAYENKNREMTEYTIHFPLYNGIIDLSIGFEENCKILSPPPFRTENPILFYGSSITQGASASRPGNAYVNILGRWFDMPVINWGFSGNAKGEDYMAKMIAGMDMSVFVYDYDHNAPDTRHLENTHKPFFDSIRAAHPKLPVIMISRPGFKNNPEDHGMRREIIKRTYDEAIRNSDQNVYFIDGEELFGEKDWHSCTVDGVHPNDLGFMRMAERIEKTLKLVLNP